MERKQLHRESNREVERETKMERKKLHRESNREVERQTKREIGTVRERE